MSDNRRRRSRRRLSDNFALAPYDRYHLPVTVTQDTALWIAAREGDASARGELAEIAAEVVRGFLRSRGVRGEELDDPVQDAQTSLLERVLTDPEPPENLRGFLKYRGYWAFGKYVRARRKERERDDEEKLHRVAGEAADPGEGLQRTDLQHAIALCRGRLNAALGETCRLRYDQDLPSAVIAERLGITTNAVRLRIFHANEQLQECLERQGVAP
jgi:RNA polymerase sigma factor (sigma-70 family)